MQSQTLLPPIHNPALAPHARMRHPTLAMVEIAPHNILKIQPELRVLRVPHFSCSLREVGPLTFFALTSSIALCPSTAYWRVQRLGA